MTLRTYIIRRVILFVFILWLVATFNFIVFGGDPLAGIYEQWMDPKTMEMLTQGFGLNGPLLYRYVMYLRNMFTYGLVPPYFGWSTHDYDFIAVGMSRRLPLTLFVLGTSLVITMTFGILLGLFAASKQETKTDAAITASFLLTWGMPLFVTEWMSVFLFSYLYTVHGIKIFPVVGMTSVPAPTGLALYADIAWHFSLPIICLVLAGIGSWVLRTRNMIVDALTQDHIVTARAKGLSERTILYKHAFKSILPPVATMITLAIPGIVTGAIMTETIFGIEGIGKWFVHALDTSVADYPVVQAVLFIYATLVIICNLIADFLYGVLDPRIRVGMRR